jgi:hypothetical protein
VIVLFIMSEKSGLLKRNHPGKNASSPAWGTKSKGTLTDVLPEHSAEQEHGDTVLKKTHSHQESHQ